MAVVDCRKNYMTRKYELLPLFQKFIKDSRSGRRKQSNGLYITAGTIAGYENSFRLINEYCIKENRDLRIIPVNRLNTRDYKREKNYWKRFYKGFTEYLYRDKSAFDNYVGYCVKPIRTFFRHINREQNIGVGDIYREFYVPSEKPQIIPLHLDKLKFLINNTDFEKCLTHSEQEVKDIFVFGCTVALRYSDLIKIRTTNIVTVNGNTYLRTISQKTKTSAQVILPEYALNIVSKFRKRRKTLFPPYNLATYNSHLKKIGEKAEWTETVEKLREVKGVPKVVYKDARKKIHYRFCDFMSSHMMRRTAITNMLMYGTDETVVRKISGHAPGSKEFFRYIEYAQNFADSQTQKYFQHLETS